MKSFRNRLVPTLVLGFLVAFSALGQNRKLGDNCEMLSLKLDAVRNSFFTGTDDGGMLILVSHLGPGETKITLSTRRLSMVSSYLHAESVFKGRIVLATGEPDNEQGRIDVFIKGRLADQLFFSRRRNGRAGHCDGL